VHSLCDVDVDGKAKALGRENLKAVHARKSPWDIDHIINDPRGMYRDEDPDMLFCWAVFGNRFKYENGFKNDLEGDPAGFMEVVRASYGYAKNNWDWDGDDSPYCCIAGVVRFMTLVADNLVKRDEDGDRIGAKCFFKALRDARAELGETVGAERKK
jgi:hypothetical protein